MPAHRFAHSGPRGSRAKPASASSSRNDRARAWEQLQARSLRSSQISTERGPHWALQFAASALLCIVRKLDGPGLASIIPAIPAARWLVEPQGLPGSTSPRESQGIIILI